MSYQPLISTETGEIDAVEIIKRAPLRAAREWGGENYPPKYLREALDWLRERADMERRQWRQERGMPSEEPQIMMQMPDWGASGDSYGRR